LTPWPIALFRSIWNLIVGVTFGFGSTVDMQLDRKLGVIVLYNLSGSGMPGEALGLWTLDRLLGNPMVDYESIMLANAKATYTDNVKRVARPADPQPSPPLAPLAGNFVNPSFRQSRLADGRRYCGTGNRRKRCQAVPRPLERCRLHRDAGAGRKVLNVHRFMP
jgi:hypothetical protein